MLIPRIPDKDPKSRFSISMHASVHVLLRKYQMYYRSVHGVDVDRATLVEEIIKAFVNKDKKFLDSPIYRENITLNDIAADIDEDE